jgi:rubrerythrin
MGTPITADYLFQIAERIEWNGQQFYRLAAQTTRDANARQVFLWLAEKEVEHKKDFEILRQRLAERSDNVIAAEPDHETADYIRALLAGKFFDATVNPEEYFTGEDSRQDILLTAMGHEKETIVFYEAIKRIVTDEETRQTLDEIIREEMRHVSQLAGVLGPYLH